VVDDLDAHPEERRKLAARFGLLGLDRLQARLETRHADIGAMVEVSGHMVADAIQQCVVTLEPLQVHIDLPIHAVFAATPPAARGQAEMDEDDLLVEPIVSGVIDLGELVAQTLGEALDPYPRKPDLPPISVEYGQPVADVLNPFARLAEAMDKPKR